MYSSLNIWLNRTRGGIAVVTSIMAVIMAAMSGIIGGEVVLLGLIALPQMLRLGYNQNLAIGTICASGSLGTMIPQWMLFGGFLSVVIVGAWSFFAARVLFFEYSGQNASNTGDPIRFGTMDYLPWFLGTIAVALLLIFFVFGLERTKKGWGMGKGLVPPIIIIGVVLGSIYMGITGITEAAGRRHGTCCGTRSCAR